MKLSPQWLSRTVVAIIAILFASARPVLADSFTIFDLGDDSGRGIYGIDTAGDVVVWSTSGCVSSSTCYVTYVNGVATTDSSTVPILAYDNGTACSSTPAGFSAMKEVCNNGQIGLWSDYSPNGDPNGAYLGSDSDPQFLHSGSVDQLFLNSAGDFAWTDGRDDEMFLAIANPAPLFETESFSVHKDFVPASTPEPASFLLVVTGLLYFTSAIRRKANR